MVGWTAVLSRPCKETREKTYRIYDLGSMSLGSTILGAKRLGTRKLAYADQPGRRSSPTPFPSVGLRGRATQHQPRKEDPPLSTAEGRLSTHLPHRRYAPALRIPSLVPRSGILGVPRTAKESKEQGQPSGLALFPLGGEQHQPRKTDAYARGSSGKSRLPDSTHHHRDLLLTSERRKVRLLRNTGCRSGPSVPGARRATVSSHLRPLRAP